MEQQPQQISYPVAEKTTNSIDLFVTNIFKLLGEKEKLLNKIITKYEDSKKKLSKKKLAIVWQQQFLEALRNASIELRNAGNKHYIRPDVLESLTEEKIETLPRIYGIKKKYIYLEFYRCIFSDPNEYLQVVAGDIIKVLYNPDEDINAIYEEGRKSCIENQTALIQDTNLKITKLQNEVNIIEACLDNMFPITSNIQLQKDIAYYRQKIEKLMGQISPPASAREYRGC